jgi:hypothetical protein
MAIFNYIQPQKNELCTYNRWRKIIFDTLIDTCSVVPFIHLQLVNNVTNNSTATEKLLTEEKFVKRIVT